VGVFGYAYFEENRNMLRALSVDNKQPTYDSIADNSYEISRPLYIYIKGEHLKKVSGLSEFVKEFLSDDAVGEFGYLTERGLIPLDTKEYEGIRKKLRSIKPLAFAVN